MIGSEFSYELLHAVYPIAEGDLQGALRRLTDAELLYVRGIAPDATYQFKHALIRDAAYEALLKSRRKDLHLMVARTIDEKFPDLKESHPELLARHWSEAGETDSAIAEWTRAGKAAGARSAFAEALESYRQALALLDLLPESPERNSRELELRQSTYLMLRIIRGYSALETIEAIERVSVLAGKTSNLRQLCISVRSRGHIAYFSGDLASASRLAVQALKLSEEHTFPDIAGLSRYLLGNIRAQLGRTKQGIGLIRQGIAELLQVGARLGTTTMYPSYLAAALEREGNVVEGLQSAELALQANREILFYLPETLRIRGQLRLIQA